MASIQSKISRGHKYWYIVESRRVNGKPRPIVLEYLGKPEDLLRRLQALTDRDKIKSYSHGAVSALLRIAHELSIPALINRHIKSHRSYMAKKPIRHGLTAGMTILLGAIGRVCMPTSKRGWWEWARTTSCEYLLRVSLSKIDSQHFWDLMDALPVAAIEEIESELLQRVMKVYGLDAGTLFLDTTNFFTFIASTNHRCTIAQRGHNKQKRNDLRQVGLAMVVTREDLVPLFHLTYQGNLVDTTIFPDVMAKLKKRIQALGLNIRNHTIVFDRGNNSKENLALIKKSKFHYVGALTPYHHKELVDDASSKFQEVEIAGRTLQVYRDKRTIWGQKRTVVVFVSESFKAGQIRGVYQSLEKKKQQLTELQQCLANPKARKQNRAKLEVKIKAIVKGQHIDDVLEWSLAKQENDRFTLDWHLNQEVLNTIEDKLGLRILMTDQHDWSTEQIIQAYHGQSKIEEAFKNVKNPYHLALRPQFHWTDQKIAVHYFICFLGYLLSSLIWRETRTKTGYNGTIDNLLDALNNVRLVTLLEKSETRGRTKVRYQLEEMSNHERQLMECLQLMDFHTNRPPFKDVGVYNEE